MPYALRTFTCIDCGGQTRRRRPDGTQQRCHPCAVAFAAEVNRQMHAKQGPMYIRWVWSQATRYNRIAKNITGAEQRRAA